jgi:hypothetical protein
METPFTRIRVVLITVLALSISPAPGFAQSNAPGQAVPPTAQEPIPVPDDEGGSSMPGSAIGSAAGVAVVVVLFVGAMLAWAEGS